MKRYAKYLISHPLFSGSAIMIFGSNFANFTAYLYHVVVGRLLGPSQYGELAAILSLVGLFTISFSFLGLVIVKFVSSSKSSEVNHVFGWFYHKAKWAGVLVMMLTALVSIPLSGFLHIPSLTVFVLVPTFYIYLVNFLFRAFLQGLLKFNRVVIATNAEIFVRLIVSIVLIYLGLAVFGTVLSILVAAALNYFLLRYLLREYAFTKGTNFKHGSKIIAYSLPIFVNSLASYSLISTDMLLVKHYFLGYDAGLYAALTTLGKIIFYGSAPISAVMFPLVVRRHAEGLPYKNIFYLSTFLTAILAFGIVGGFALMPKLAILPLYGAKYLSISSSLAQFGLVIGLFAVCSLIVNYFLSIERTRVVIIMPIAAIVQIFGIYLFHSSASEVISVNIAVMSGLLLFLGVYFVYDSQKN